jgi:hypothetical protein
MLAKVANDSRKIERCVAEAMVETLGGKLINTGG